MVSSHLNPMAILLMLWFLALCLDAEAHLYNVVDYQAIGDGNSDDTDALLNAWGEACVDSRNPTLVIPSGKAFLLKETTLEGPCRSSIHVQVRGDIVAPDELWTSKTTSLLTFRDVNSLKVDGGGQIVGRGSIWWDCVAEDKGCTERPYALSFIGCNDLRVSGITIKDSPSKHMAIDTCEGVHVEGITITAPGDSPNTDGIVVADSRQVLITASTIGTGDDCIALGSGSSDINISRITCGPGHGISIGSLGKDGDRSTVENIHVSHCHIFQAMTGVRIKTWQGGSGFAKEILFEHINFASVETPVVIDQYYNPGGQEESAKEKSSSVAVSNVRFVDLHGSSAQEVAISLACSKEIPCQGIVIKDVSLDWGEGDSGPPKSLCLNADVDLIGQVIPQINCLN